MEYRKEPRHLGRIFLPEMHRKEKKNEKGEEKKCT